MVVPAAGGQRHSIGGHREGRHSVLVPAQSAQGVGRQGVPVVDVIVVTPAQNMAPAQGESTGREGTRCTSAVLRHLLIGADVKETCGLVLTSCTKSVAPRMELKG